MPPVQPRRATLATLMLLAACGGTPSGTATNPQPGTTVPPIATITGTAPATSAPKLPPENGPGYTVDVRPENFPTATKVDNPYFPLTPGTRATYDGNGEDGPERTVTKVTRETKTILGVATVVVHDTVLRDGTLYEDTYDWYAQDKDGNVWYFGEDTRALDDKTGKLTDTTGSWQAGVSGAQPGIIMKAHPAVGDSFYQEYLKGEAEDQADVTKTGETLTVPYGSFTDAIRTKDYTALETAVVENKIYARGLGVIHVEHVTGPAETMDLVTIEHS